MIRAQKTPLPGVTAITLANGQQVYAVDGSNYLVIGVIYDLNTGKTLQNTLDPRTPVSAAETTTPSSAMAEYHHFLAPKD